MVEENSENVGDLLDSVSNFSDNEAAQKAASVEKMSEDEAFRLFKEEFGNDVEKIAESIEKIIDFDRELEELRPVEKIAELADFAAILDEKGVLDDGINENRSGSS